MFDTNRIDVTADEIATMEDLSMRVAGGDFDAKFIPDTANDEIGRFEQFFAKFLENQTREQRYGMEHIAIDTDELDALVKKLEGQGINILEQTVVSGGRRVCFFEGPDGVQLEFIEMK